MHLLSLATFALGIFAVSAAAPTGNGGGGSTEVALNSDTDFCLFLPPQPGLEVATHEDDGVSFCLNPSTVPGSRQMPDGFITVAHYSKTDSYTQVTGYIDASKYSLAPTDGGGQYDTHGSGKPIGASCKGYPYFVSLIEPDVNRFCIRCCQNVDDCPYGRSGYGCLRVIPGDYSGAPGNATTGNSAASSTTTGSSTADDNNTTGTEHSNTGFNYVLSEMDQAGMTQNTTPASDNAGGSSAIDAFPQAINTLKDQLNQQVSPDQIKTEWNNFLENLAAQYPESASSIKELEDATANYSTTENWQHLVQVLETKIASSSPSQQTATPSETLPSHSNQATW